LINIEQCLTSPPTQYTCRLSGRQFYRSKDPANSIKVLMEMPDRVKPLLVIFDIRELWRSALNVRVPGCQKLQMTA